MQTTSQNDNYIFISYAHKDAKAVLPIIHALRENGYNVWFDEGIEAGTEWPEYLAKRIKNCAVFIAFISPDSIKSNNCRNEINFAITLKKEILTIYLEETEMTMGMQLQLGSLQAMFRYRHKNDESFINALLKAELLRKLVIQPPPVQTEVIPTPPPIKNQLAPVNVKNEKTPPKKNSKRVNLIEGLTAIVALLAVCLGATVMNFTTAWTNNGWLIFSFVTLTPITIWAIYALIIRKVSNDYSYDERSSIYEAFCGLILVGWVAATITDCFFIQSTDNIFFKILISLGINFLAYLIALMITSLVEPKKY